VALKIWPAIVSVAEREDGLVLAAALNVTLPSPEPDPPVTVIHDGLFVVVHVQPAGAETATVVLSPSVANAFDPGLIVSLQFSAACVALKVLPAIVTEPVRGEVPVLGVAVIVTVPFPEPLEPAVTDSQPPLLLTAVQLQPAGAVTVTVVLSPAVANVFDPGLIVSLQLMPAWVALNVWPAIVIVPEREDGLVFAAAVSVTLPSPEPDPPVTVIHDDALFVVVQLQPAGAETAMVVLSPAIANAFDPGLIVSLQVSAAWVALNVLPAIVTEPVRDDVPVLAVADTVTVPFPMPLEPAVTDSHELLLTAVQLQAPGAVTVMSVLSPAIANAFELGEIVSLQVTPACVALKLLPAIVRVPERPEVPVLADAASVTLPLPEPDPPVTVIHGRVLVVDHAQPVGDVTATLVLSPAVAKAFDVGEIV